MAFVSYIASPANSAPVALFLGDMAEWAAENLQASLGYERVFANMRDLTARLLAESAPKVIYSALCAPDHDAIEVAQLLQELGYDGRYVAVSGPLPRPSLVEREIAAMAPDLTFEVMVTQGA
ncbi:MAG: hypothetical protein ACU0CO_12050 [Shimia sp.]